MEVASYPGLRWTGNEAIVEGVHPGLHLQTRGSHDHLQITCRSVCDRDQES